MSKLEQVKAQHGAKTYFDNNEEFELEDYARVVAGDGGEAFIDYRDQYSKASGVALMDEFGISGAAVKKKKTLLASKIKLDDNFVVSVAGRTDLIERGYDEEKGLKFYKLYFQDEE